MAWGWNQALATSVGSDTLTSTATLIIVKCIQVAKKNMNYYHSSSVRDLDELDQGKKNF